MHSIPSSVAQALQQRILSGEYPSGSRLPPQRELAESLGVSRASLREALTVLETLGLVDILPSRGVVVRGQKFGAEGASAERMHRPFATPALGTLSPRQLIELRLVLEPGWTALAAARMHAAGLRHLQWLQQQLAHALERNDLLSAAEADLHFHLLLAQLSSNPGLMAMAGQLEHAIGHSLRLPFARNGADDHPAHEHDAIGWRAQQLEVGHILALQLRSVGENVLVDREVAHGALLRAMLASLLLARVRCGLVAPAERVVARD